MVTVLCITVLPIARRNDKRCYQRSPNTHPELDVSRASLSSSRRGEFGFVYPWFVRTGKAGEGTALTTSTFHQCPTDSSPITVAAFASTQLLSSRDWVIGRSSSFAVVGMSLESLPDELLVAISKELPSFPNPSNSFGTFPIVELDPVLRALCATNKRLRAIFIRELYTNVVFNFRRKALEVHFECVRHFLRVTRTQGASRFIRCVPPSVQISGTDYNCITCVDFLEPSASETRRRCLYNSGNIFISEAI